MSTTTLTPRQRLLAVASRLFYAEGIHAVGIDRVIAEASVAKATLYAHFPSKADLVAAYLSNESQLWVDEANRRLARSRPGAKEAIRALFEMLYENSLKRDYRGCPFINAAAEFPSPSPVATQIDIHRDRLRQVFATATGTADTTSEMLDALVSLYGGAMTAAQLDHRPQVVLHAANAAEHFFVEATM
ncbi:MAG: TetR/AcrR family transcriptional regulator [Acidobacteria bacterium]|nr:TetR/AcrR family transcriptional regulator [Acidobacteriota bacterium]